jgi:hypothetical protein
MQEGPAQVERAKFFGKVEKAKSDAVEIVNETGESSDCAPKRKSWSGPSRSGPKSPHGMRKNVWEVRKK